MRDRKSKIWFLLSNQSLISGWTVEKPEPSVVVIYIGLFGLTRTPFPLSKVSCCQILFRCKQKLNWDLFFLLMSYKLVLRELFRSSKIKNNLWKRIVLLNLTCCVMKHILMESPLGLILNHAYYLFVDRHPK